MVNMQKYSLLEIIKKYLTSPSSRFTAHTEIGIYNRMTDENFLKRKYYLKTNQNLNLDNPTKFTEKLQWIKLYDRKTLYTTLVDKYRVKKYVADNIGEEYVIPLLGVWENANDIDFDSLPNRFVIKPSHDSSGLLICRDKSQFAIKKARKKLNRSLRKNYFYAAREWPYKNVKPCIIAEEYMEDDQDGELRDYKFFCFNGEPKILYITQGRGLGDSNQTYADFFDMNYNFLDCKIDHDNSPSPPHPPKNFELMKILAAKLSRDIPHVRVDFYEVDGKVFFGEMTFFHCGGFCKFTPEEWDDIWGSWIELPQKESGEFYVDKKSC